MAGHILDAITDSLIDLCKAMPFMQREVTDVECEPAEHLAGEHVFAYTTTVCGKPMRVAIPPRDTCALPDVLYDLWLDLIVYRTLYRVYMFPSNPLRDVGLSGWYLAKYKEEFNTFIITRSW
jgi:hypothetical protein